VGANQTVSVKVTLPDRGTAERIMHFNNGTWYGSTDIVGASQPRTEWDFAEGSTLSYYSEFLSLQNPNSSQVTVDLNYATDIGAHPVKTLTLAPGCRTSVVVFQGDLSNSLGCQPTGAAANCGVGRG